MNAVARVENNELLAARFIQTVVAWFPKADPDPIWTKQAIEALTPYPKGVFVKMHELAKLELKGFPSVPALKQLANRAALAMTETKPPKTDAEFERERMGMADDVILRHPDGRQAVEEGWWFSLWQQIAIHGPKYDFEQCRKAAIDAANMFNGLMAKTDRTDLENMAVRVRQTGLERKALVAKRLGLPH